jgi:hypothetical protein
MTIKQQVILARANGASYSQITEEFGIAKSTARDWVQSGDLQVQSDTYVNDNLQRIKPTKFQKTEDEVLEFLGQLAPIKISNSKKTHRDVTFNDYVVVLGDMHFPKHCQKSIDVAFETISQLQPKQIVLNGDTIDMLAVSRYPKDIRNNYSLLEEREAYHKFLDELINVSNGASIVETHANHSGNGTDGRWFRYLSERLGELGSLPDIQEKLSYQNVFLG